MFLNVSLSHQFFEIVQSKMSRKRMVGSHELDRLENKIHCILQSHVHRGMCQSTLHFNQTLQDFRLIKDGQNK
jgi:hypothetical protein